jgi:hypothetical protein
MGALIATDATAVPFEVGHEIFFRQRGIVTIEKSLDETADDLRVGTIAHQLVMAGRMWWITPLVNPPYELRAARYRHAG